MRTIANAAAYVSPPLDRATGDFGAIYYPWIWRADPIGTGRNPKILLPPSGFIAGIYARIDNSRGVFKAPRGTEAGVAGAVAVATTVSDVEQDQLNPVSVNVIRTVPGSGYRRLGNAHHRQRCIVALYPGAPHGDLPARQHLLWHPMGGVRAERRAAVGQRCG